MSLWRHFVYTDQNMGVTRTDLIENRLWQALPIGFIKLNVDGLCSPYEAEEWAVLKGLEQAMDMGLRKTIIGSDSQILVNSLRTMVSDGSQSLLALQIRNLMDLSWEVQLNHIFLECKHVADRLAKNGLSTSASFETCLVIWLDKGVEIWLVPQLLP
ncbi:hypothetical protein QN277_012622 [Acacia crassicarpa]|uniref:RNase H type-1 domain-containing protein n=1 Tax=Acacia crassicarpa TaxID=499986 RepID=A0AAE1TD80_9FABA|nr:hypothetical protein QN277_012622 [Acacia crassicarpa]